MTPEAYERMWRLYDEARQRTPAEWGALLDERCAGDPDLRDEVARLLAQAETRAGPGLLDEPCPLNIKAHLPDAPDDPLLGRHIGPYQIKRLIASGGMGSVYLAVRLHDFKQRVAVKLIKRGMDTEEILRRFRDERQVLAALRHPNIARLLDGGTLDDRPYFIMEYIEGLPLDQYCKAHPLTTEQRLHLFRSICAAVDYAHQNQVIHRDLKPGNILVGTDGIPKLVDFGIAKLLNPELGCQTASPTRTGWQLATPDYASPEQIQGGAVPDRTSDVYALGVVLYELLTDHRPIPASGLPAHEAARVVRERVPTPPRRWRATLSRDLEAICLKCLRKQPGQRYASAADLADDLERFLAGKAVAARPRGIVERGWRRCRRSPGLASLAALMTVAFLAATGLATHFAFRAQSYRQETRDIARQAKEEERLASLLRYAERMNLAQLALRDRQFDRMLAILEELRPRDGEEDLRGFEWYYLWRRHHTETRSFKLDISGAVALSPEGDRIAGGAPDKTVKVWELRTGKELFSFSGHANPISSLAFSRDGQRLASASTDGAVTVWDLQTRAEAFNLPGEAGPVTSLAFGPDGRQLAGVGQEKNVTIWDLHNRMGDRSIQGYTAAFTCVAFSPNGQWLAGASKDKTVKVWDPRTGAELLSLTGHTSSVTSIAFSPDSRRLASTGWDGMVLIWEARTDEFGPSFTPVLSFKGRDSGNLKLNEHSALECVAFGPDGRLLVTGGAGRRLAAAPSDYEVQIWSASTGAEILAYSGHPAQVNCVALSPDGRQLISAGKDGTVMVSDAAASQESLPLWGHSSLISSVAFSLDGERFASASWDHTVQLWETRTRRRGLCLTGHKGEVTGVAFSPDGQRIATASLDATVKVWDAQTGKELFFLKHPQGVTSVAFSPDGGWIATASAEKMRIWDIQTSTPKEIRSFPGYSLSGGVSVAFSHDGRRLASLRADGTVMVWDASTGESLQQMPGQTSLVLNTVGVGYLAFSPDDRHLATTSAPNHTVRVLDVATGETVLTLRGHTGTVLGVAYSPDGRRLATTSIDETVKVWDATTGEEVFSSREYGWPLGSLAFTQTKNGAQYLALGGLDGGVRLWSAPREP